MFTNGRLKTLDEVKLLVQPYGGIFFDYLAVKNAILKSTIIQPIDDTKLDFQSIFKLSNQALRHTVVYQKQEPPLNCVGVWRRRFDIHIEQYYSLAKQSTKESKLRALHFKLIHNIYPTNLLLFKMKIKSSAICDNCNEIDYVEHAFFTCPKLRPFWQRVEELIERILEIPIHLQPVNALLGFEKSFSHHNIKKISEANHLLLLSKFCIIKQKFSQANTVNYIFNFELMLRSRYFPSLKEAEH